MCPTLNFQTLRSGGLTQETANLMIENCIGVISVPVGLGLNFLINDQEYAVPMAIEEPSVIAACSGIAKLISSEGNGFKVVCS